MSEVRLRQTTHRGSVLASGLAIETRLVPESTARRRILELSSTALRVFRAETLLIVLFRNPVRMDCMKAMGTPLVRQGRHLSSAPLEADERKALPLSLDAVVLVVGGNAVTLSLDDLAPEDISSWIDVSAFLIIADVYPLGEVISKPKAAATDAKVDVRQSLGATPLTDGARNLAQSLARGGSPSNARGGLGSSMAAAISGFLSGLLHFIKTAVQRVRFRSRSTSPSRELAVVSNAGRPGGSWFSRVQSALSHLAARALLWSRLAPFVGRRHAEYLARMLEMFDSNHLEDALRHAIPLSSELEAAFRPPPLRTPSPRSDLAIVPGRAAASTSIGLGADLLDELRQRYRRAFERLAERGDPGDIEKAAFVLAELLNANEEAVSFLEQHKRFKLAAEIAEARKLPPGLVIRLWFLAGERARAIRIARQTGAFGDAVVRLERTHKEEAQALRLFWADRLASGGAYAAAVDAVWPVADARNLALTWLDRAIDVGGVTGARMLARKARLVPTEFSEIRDGVLHLLQDPYAELPVLQALGQELANGEATPETRVLAGAIARRLLRNADDRDVDRLVQHLLDVSGDAALRADVRTSPSVSDPKRSRRERIWVRAFACTHEGKGRTINEDACVISFLATGSESKRVGAIDDNAKTKGIVLAVFDGLCDWDAESSADGASRMAADTVVTLLQSEFSTCGADPGQWARSLAVSLEQANRRLYEAGVASPSHRGIGSAATVATLCGDKLFVAQLGHTRAYVLRGNTLVQVTRDHNFLAAHIAKMREEGTPLTQEQIDEFPHKNVVTRTMGTSENVAADISQVELEDGDVILLCTDGLWSVVNEAQLEKILLENHTPQVACDVLLSTALEAGAPDNISIVVARVEGKELPRAGRTIVYSPFVPPAIDGRNIQSAAPLTSRLHPVEIRRGGTDCGTMEVLDAAELPDGRMLVALGEIGVWLLSREGNVLTRFAEPASRLVISDHGDRAILVAPRGEACRVARLDLVTKRVRRWCDARFDQFAPDFDGLTWFVARGDTVYAIDATADPWEHQWKVEERGGTVRALQRNTETVCIWFAHKRTNGEMWTFALPSLTLRQRQRIENGDARFLMGATSSGATFAGWSAQSEKGRIAQAFVRGSWKDLPITTAAVPDGPYVTDEWMAFPVVGREGTTIHLFDSDACLERMRIDLDGALRNAGVRFQGQHLLVFDERGRVLVVSLRSGAVIREHRIS